MRILIADDSALVRKTAREILAAEDCVVVAEASDGFEAVQAVEALRPDLVLLDTVMPGMSTVETLAAIRGIDPTAHVVVCTSLGQEQLARVALAMGAWDAITKPLQPGVLCGLVERATRKRLVRARAHLCSTADWV